MATKAKESSIVGKKKALSSNSHTTITKRTTKPSATTTNSTNKPNSTSSEKKIPNYLKPTKTSLLESPTSEQSKSDSPNSKPFLAIRRRSLDKPLSSSNLTRSLTIPHRSSIGPVNKSIIPSKPISASTSKAPSDGKTKPLVTKGTKKTIPTNTTTSTRTKKGVNKDHASVNLTKSTPKETTKILKVETEQVKEVTSQEVEVIKVENEEQKVHEVKHVNDHVPPDVESEHEIEHVQGLDNYDPPQYKVDDERVISTVSEAGKQSLEEKAKNEEHELEEDNKTNQYEGGNNNESDHQENHEAEVVVNDEDEGEGGEIIMEDHKSENKNNEEEVIEEQKEAVEKVEENKVEATPSKQKLGERRHGKMEAQVSNDEIEKTAKLLEARKNKVRALAGAFQTVIDHQTTSK